MGTRRPLMPLGVDEPSLHTDQLSTWGKQHREEPAMLQNEPDIYPALIFTQLLAEIKSSPVSHDSRYLPHCGVKGHASLLEFDSAILSLVSSSASSMLKSASRWMRVPGPRNPQFELRRVHSEGRLTLLIWGIPPMGLSLSVSYLGAQPPNSTTRLCLAELSKER